MTKDSRVLTVIRARAEGRRSHRPSVRAHMPYTLRRGLHVVLRRAPEVCSPARGTLWPGQAVGADKGWQDPRMASTPGPVVLPGNTCGISICGGPCSIEGSLPVCAIAGELAADATPARDITHDPGWTHVRVLGHDPSFPSLADAIHGSAPPLASETSHQKQFVFLIVSPQQFEFVYQ